jgi:hypothetical protein
MIMIRKRTFQCIRRCPTPYIQVVELLALGKAYMVMGNDAKGEQLLKSAWARGGDPFELANAQVSKPLSPSAASDSSTLLRKPHNPRSVQVLNKVN